MNTSRNGTDYEPAIIVGIEVDVESKEKWWSGWPRPLSIVQWTFRGSKGHPIFIDAMRRTLKNLKDIEDINFRSLVHADQCKFRQLVVEKTGPAVLTDSVLRCDF